MKPSPLHSSSRFLSVACGLLSAALFCSATFAADSGSGPFVVTPGEVQLNGNFAQTQLVVTSAGSDGSMTDRSHDLTPTAKYASADEKIVTISANGRLLAVGNGKTEIVVTVGKNITKIPVTVAGIETDPQIDFTKMVAPVLSKAGCNMGACHASQYGKGGFKLSVFGFEPREDWEYIVRDRRQRRVNLLDPEASLFLKKPTMQVPHGGSQRLKKESVDYQILVAWMQAGCSEPRKDAPKTTSLTITPARRVGPAGMKQQIRVDAAYSDGSVRDVTAWAKFDSMDEGVLEIDRDGLVTAVGKGQAPIMVRFEGQAEIAMFVIPYADAMEMPGWKSNNFVDALAAAKFRELGIEPSPLCDDATFIRRAFLDAIGSLPTQEEAEAFITSTDPAKRDQLVNRLLGLTGDPNLDTYNDRYAAYWTLKWSDLIRNDSRKVGEQGMWAMHNWIKESFRTNKPFDKFVSELVTAKGSIYSNGPANYFRINSNSTDLAESTAQLFLGVRLQCAKCHHHPFEKYSQADYYRFAAYFSRVGTKNSEEFGLFGRESVVMVRSSGTVRHPRTRKVMQPTPLGGEPSEPSLDLRIPLAKWLTSKENKQFANSVVNRYVSYFMGRGLVEPVDDMRATNPPTNVALMDALAKEFTQSDFNLKHLIKTIMVSRLYQLSSQPTESNASDDRFYSHYKVKRLAAEPLLDAIDAVTGVQTKFKSLPAGTRAIELPDAEPYYGNYFLTTFAKPKRASVCECERIPDENLAQALHTLNGDILASKIAGKSGRIAKLLAAKKPHDFVIDSLYLTTLSRHPSEPEKTACRQFLKESPSPKECYEDILWALMNSKHFLFVH